MRHVTRILSAGFCILLITAPVLAQRTSGIQGLVTDASGAVIPGASVTINNQETGIKQTVSANETGFYTAPALTPGLYTVECSSRGMAGQTRQGIRLEVGLTARIDFQLSVGAVAEVVKVSAAATLIQSEKSEVGQVIDNKRILEMPLNGRNYLELAKFTVGVLPAQNGTGRGERTGYDAGFISLGTRGYQNNVLLDGADNSARSGGGVLGYETQAAKPSVDAVAEFKVVTNNVSAEYGFGIGSKVLVSTKSGTNAFHGSLYEFLRNDSLDGTNFFANRAGAKKPQYNQNQFGASLGGPISKNRTFFFASYQGTRIRKGGSAISSVPTAQLRTGDFNGEPATNRNIFDPATTTGTGADCVRLPFAGNIIPKSRWDPLAGPLVDLYPLPNTGGPGANRNNYFASFAQQKDWDQYDFRVDHNLSANQRFFARYSRRIQDETDPGPLPLPADGGSWQIQKLRANNWAGNLTSVIGNAMTNEARFGYTYFPTKFDIPYDKNLNQVYGLKNAPSERMNADAQRGWGDVSPAGFTGLGTMQWWPEDNDLNVVQIADSLFWQKGRHSIKFGGEYRRELEYRLAYSQARGLFNFSGQYTAQYPNIGSSRANTGNGLADMLLGTASGVGGVTPDGENIAIPFYGFFVQDDWKVSSKLTVNVGLRWEWYRRITHPGAPNEFPNDNVLKWYYPRLHGVSEAYWAQPKDGHDSGQEENYRDFGPRFGLAYRVTPGLVVRAGGAILYGRPSAPWAWIAYKSILPLRQSISVVPSLEIPEFFMKNGYPDTAPRGQVPSTPFSIWTMENKNPDVMNGQWFLDIQKQLPFDTLLTVAYNGSSTSHLEFRADINTPYTPSATVRAYDRRIDRKFATVGDYATGDNANYNSLTVKVEKRFSRGLTFLSSFTWSHAIDQFNTYLDGGTGGQGDTDQATTWDRSYERGSSSLDRRLSYNLSSIYELPLGKGKRYLQSGPGAWVLGGWQVGGILGLYSGTPQDHTFNVDNQNTGGKVRGDYVRNPSLAGSQRSIDRWFDTSFVKASAPGVISNSARNLIVGPGVEELRFRAVEELHHALGRSSAPVPVRVVQLHEHSAVRPTEHGCWQSHGGKNHGGG